jgi:predicted alpha/beta-hydrolase family hydrolase
MLVGTGTWWKPNCERADTKRSLLTCRPGTTRSPSSTIAMPPSTRCTRRLSTVSDLVVVGQSFGAFTAPLVADRLQAAVLVLVAGMVPAPAEPPTIGGATLGSRPLWQNRRLLTVG